MTFMWSLLTALFVLALWGMNALLSNRGITFTFGQWVVYVVWLLWTLFGVAMVWTFVDEKEPRAVRVSALVFGGLATVSGVALALLWVFP